MENVIVKKGKVLVYRVFDVASEIDLDKVEHILTEDQTKERFKLDRKHNMSLVVSTPPLSVNLGTCELTFEDKKYTADVYVRAWHFGTLSINYQINIPEGTSWTSLLELAHLLEKDQTIDTLARSRANDFSKLISGAIPVTNEWSQNEDYVIYFIQEFENGLTAKDIKGRVDLASLILAEPKGKLSEQIIKATLDYTFQYLEEDLSVIDWNSALIVEPSGSMDIPLVIEFALGQLLEMRYYDDLLDERLNTLYNEVAQRKRGLLSNRYSKLAEEAGQIYLEIAEIVESVENSLKVVGDFYLATIFRAASTRFRFSDWQKSINEKLSNLAEVSKLLHSEVNESRNQMLEIIIILLIAVEVVPLFKTWFF